MRKFSLLMIYLNAGFIIFFSIQGDWVFAAMSLVLLGFWYDMLKSDGVTLNFVRDFVIIFFRELFYLPAYAFDLAQERRELLGAAERIVKGMNDSPTFKAWVKEQEDRIPLCDDPACDSCNIRREKFRPLLKE